MSRILTALSIVCLSFPVGWFVVAACHTDSATIKADAGKVWDCASPERANLVAALAPVAVQLLEAAVDAGLGRPFPTIDYAPVLAALAGVRDDVLPCLIAVATGEVMTRAPRVSLVGAPTESGQLLRATFERLRVERFGRATFVGVTGL